MNNVIYLKLKQKQLLLQAEQITYFQSECSGLKKIFILSENNCHFFEFVRS